MAEPLTPLQMVQGLLQGTAPPRPLFLPIVFSHGARVENLSLRAFLANPTKISNSLRQIHSHLHADGMTCYFDPFLEAEALGGTLDWAADDQPPAVRLPEGVAQGEWPEESRSFERSARFGRIAVAVEVIRRLKSVVRDNRLLMAGLSGPWTLAALLTGTSGEEALSHSRIPAAVFDLAASTIAQIATAFVEAGAKVIFFREDVLPVLSEQSAGDWISWISQPINIIRFYQALPVLLLTCPESVAANREVILRQPWDCVVCPVLDGMASEGAGGYAELGAARFGVALRREAFDAGAAGGADLRESVRRTVAELHPAVVTTAGDVPAAADVERLNQVWENIR